MWPLFYNLQTKEDHWDNRKEIHNKPGCKYLILEKNKNYSASHNDGVGVKSWTDPIVAFEKRKG